MIIYRLPRLEKMSQMDDDETFVEFKGVLTEQYVLQQLFRMQNIPLYAVCTL